MKTNQSHINLYSTFIQSLGFETMNNENKNNTTNSTATCSMHTKYLGGTTNEY